MPEASAYRKYTEDIVSSRLQHVETVCQERNIILISIQYLFIKEPNIALLERKINCGQIEEVIVQVNNIYFQMILNFLYLIFRLKMN